ncbi:MAG: 50S ribosomal protein L4 [Parachlamydiales bacterium]|nr:50S ribosomal protein L4 [Parachlamydiales bacterium]
MATLKKYDISGKEVGQEEFDISKIKKANPQMIKDYMVALHGNSRQWSANTKGRKEVNRTGAKPHRQKGTGRARQGCFAAPQYKGGGIVFGPKPKFDQHIKRNKKEKRGVINALLSDKIKDNKALILKVDDKDVTKTKQFTLFLKNLSLLGSRILLIAKPQINQNIKRCIKNIQKAHISDSSKVNGYEIALANSVIFVDDTLDDIKAMLTKG